MHYIKRHITPWILPSAATMAFLFLLIHKSEFPVLFDRYSIKYTLVLILFGLNLGLLWRKSVLAISYKHLIRRILLRSLLSFGVLLIPIIFLVNFLFGMRVPSSPSDWVILTLLFAALMQGESLQREHNRISKLLALSAASIALSIILLELVFVFLLVESHIPRTHSEFVQLMPSLKLWPQPVTVERPQGTFRILGLSDSFGTAGGTTSNYHYLLENMLRRDVSPTIEMLNVSVPGYEPRHQLDILRFGIAYSPDLVIHGFFVGNDFSLLKHDIYVYRDIWIFRDPAIPRYRPRHFLTRYWIANTIRFFQEKWSRQQELKLGIVKTQGNFSAARHLKGQFDRMNVWGRPTNKDIDRMKEIFPILDAIRSVVEQNGARYVMVIHPDETQVNERVRWEILERFKVKEEEYDFDLPSKVLKSYCTDRRILCLDLLPSFRAKAKEKELYLLRDSHYNEAGNELAAANISQFLRTEQLVPNIGQKISGQVQASQ